MTRARSGSAAVTRRIRTPAGTGTASLPAARRRGVGVAVTAALVDHATSSGPDLVFLSATDDDVARIYEREGFRRVAHAGLAGVRGA
jgi:hypothetical protein